MKALYSHYRMMWTAAVLTASPLLAGADGGGCQAGGKIHVGSGAPGADAGGATGDAGESCTQAVCAGLPVLDDAKICSDGTTLGRSVCATSPYTGKCEWDFPACPAPDASTACVCVGPAPSAPIGMCPDGSVSGPVCAVDTAASVPGMPAPPVHCSWALRSCPQDAGAVDSGSATADASGASCAPADCAGLGAPAIAKVCPDGSTVAASVCAPSPVTMKCDWEFAACPVPDGGSCAAIARSALTAVQGVLDVPSNTSCAIDADCQIVAVSSTCFDECTRSVNLPGAANLQSAIAAANAGACTQFLSAGCAVSVPPCIAPLPAQCVAGRCQ